MIGVELVVFVIEVQTKHIYSDEQGCHRHGAGKILGFLMVC